MVEKLLTYKNFTVNGTITGVSPFMDSIVTSVPSFFPLILFFLIWMGGTIALYVSVLKLTGYKRFWESLTAISFVTFLISIPMLLSNTTTITYLSGYWSIFYLLATVFSWIIMSNYK